MEIPVKARARRGFTLIELLVSLAILMILAGIALPNYMDAQIRSKVARVKSDMRAIAVALEAYKVENGKYPPSTLIPPRRRLIPLTTPMAHLGSIPGDLFELRTRDANRNGSFVYSAAPIDRESRHALISNGPDRIPYNGYLEYYPGYREDIWERPASGYAFVRYDPSNGAVSLGDIWRVSDHAMD